MRLFVAIPVGAGTREDLESLVARLRRPGDGLKWAAAAGWHITLAFLGEASAAQLQLLTERLTTVQSAPFFVGFAAPEIFDRAGALVVSVRLSAELAALQCAVTAATAACGFVPETRAYRSHLTLARARRGERLHVRLDSTQKIVGFMAKEFVLYESFLGLRGARYEARSRFELKS